MARIFCRLLFFFSLTRIKVTGKNLITEYIHTGNVRRYTIHGVRKRGGKMKKYLISKGFLLLLAASVIVALALSGCGGNGSSDSSISQNSSGNIIVSHSFLSDEDSGVQQVRFTAIDDSGTVVYGPKIIAADQALRHLPAGRKDQAEGVTLLEKVPTSAVFLRTEYLVDGSPQAFSTVPVNVPENGETMVVYPGDSSSPVHLAYSKDSQTPWSLICDGQPLFIKGVGFDYQAPNYDWNSGSLDSGDWFSYINPDIGRSGANVIRTYGIPTTSVYPPGDVNSQVAMMKKMLAYAAEASKTSPQKVWVLAGIYAWANDTSTTEDFVKSYVKALQNDPNYGNLLGYCIGNEVDPSQFGYINGLMGAAKSVMPDGNTRPLFTATFNVGGTDTERVKALQGITNMDVLGINSYYGKFGSSVPKSPDLSTEYKELIQAGWKGPWAITEFCTYNLPSGVDPGMGQTLNGNVKYCFELNSTDRAVDLKTNWNSYIASASAQLNGCLGGMVLNWGPPHNSKFIAHWHMFYTYRGDFDSQNPYHTPPYTESGFNRLSHAYAVAQMYGGTLSAPHCPEIVLGDDNDPQGITCVNSTGESIKAGPASQAIPMDGGAKVIASVRVKDSDNLTFSWYLVGGSNTSASGDITGPGQDPQYYCPSTTALIGGSQLAGSQEQKKSNGITTSTVTFNLPVPKQAGNNYQLRVVVSDTTNSAATAAVAIRMK